MRHWLEICQQWQRYLWFEISLSTKSGSQGWVLKSRILMIHVFITDGHEIYLVILVIYAFIANLSESQGSTALKFTWESLWFEPSLCSCPNHNGKQSRDSPRNLVIWALTVDLGNNCIRIRRSNSSRIHYRNLMIYERHNYSAAGEKKLAF